MNVCATMNDARYRCEVVFTRRRRAHRGNFTWAGPNGRRNPFPHLYAETPIGLLCVDFEHEHAVCPPWWLWAIKRPLRWTWGRR